MSSTSGARSVNAAGLSLIKDFEGLRLEAYLCPAGVWTIGYGHTEGISRGQKITQDQAEKLLREDLARYEQAVSRLVRLPIGENQFAALVSFAFNLGESALASSTLLQKLNGGNHAGASEEFGRWVYAGNPPTKLEGLVRRRAAERDLFLRSDTAAPKPASTSWLLTCPAEDWQNAIPVDPAQLDLLAEVAKRLALPWKRDEGARKAYLGRRSQELTTDKPAELTLAQRISPQKQSTSKSCGQCSVAMAITTLTGEKWRDLDVAARYGFSLLQALNGECPKHEWQDAGNFTRSMWDQVERSLAQGLPVIIGLNGPDFSPSGYGHLVLLVGVEGDRVTLADPAWGKLRTVTHKQIEDCPPHSDGKFVFLCRKK